jgi:DNA-binding NarL/FixJ family response regulator
MCVARPRSLRRRSRENGGDVYHEELSGTVSPQLNQGPTTGDRTTPEREGKVAGCAVVVGSDVRLYSEGLALVFAADGRLRVSRVAETAHRTLQCVTDDDTDALLIDATMPDVRNVLDVMKTRKPHIPVIIFGVPELDEDLVDYIDGGAAAFVSRNATSQELISTVLSATRGEIMLSHGSVAHVLGRLAKRARLGVTPPRAEPSLTAREAQLASLLDEGLSNKEIAQRLQISVATVKNHVHRILEKLHVERRGQAVSRLRHSMDQRI